MMSSSSWLTTLECSPQSFETNSQWLSFIFLSPCPQRLLFSFIDLLFLVTLIVFALKKLALKFNSTSSIIKPLLQSDRSELQVTFRFKFSLVLASLLALAYTILCVLTFVQILKSPWNIIEPVFQLTQAMTFAAISILIFHEKKYQAVVHPVSLQMFWVANFVISTLFACSAIGRLFFLDRNYISTMKAEDVFSLVNFPISVFFFVVAIQGSSGLTSNSTEVYEPVLLDSNVSKYATASFFSKCTWLWMNPVLSKGYKSTLKMDEVPTLPPDHRAERMAELFQSNWPESGENMNNPVIKTLVKCFWKEIALAGFLAIVRLAVMYTGPLLIQSFIDFTSGKGKSNPAKGYYLVLTLLFAKIIEVLSSHQFNFVSMKLGMLIRSSIITSLYKKGLRLTCSSRQAHGVGQIVNYMAVDAQQLSDMMLQLHALWLMPLQVGVALVLLYSYFGLSSVAALVSVIVVMIFTLVLSKTNNVYQYNVMINRDSRMKATNEMLNNMRVIKFQAWEEHFHQRIKKFRDLEYKWLSKFMYSISLSMVVMWSTPVLLAALTFAVAILTKVNLNAGTVFTATTIFRILQDPVRAFPQALISISQAMISLNRVDSYMTSKDLNSEFVSRDEDTDGRIAVEVKCGSFSWDDDGSDVVLKDVNFLIKKGQLAAIVGTVGSGKSSLLASVLGELHKISGNVRVCGSTAYVAQTSWIQNASVKENILFGSDMEVEKYNEVLRVCCLEKDLEAMEDGDETEIGERGINLSGGQKQRIQLARAVYHDSDIYLLDDVFSAVDAQTGSQIFKVNSSDIQTLKLIFMIFLI